MGRHSLLLAALLLIDCDQVYPFHSQRDGGPGDAGVVRDQSATRDGATRDGPRVDGLPAGSRRVWRTATSVGPTPGPRQWVRLAALPDGEGLLLYGGVDEIGTVMADAWRYDDGSWTKLCDPCDPGPRVGEGLASVDGELLLYGGIDSLYTAPDAELWRRRVDGVWERVTSIAGPGPLHRQLMVYDPERQRVVVVGGMDAASGTPREAVYEYDVVSGNWVGPLLPTPRPGPLQEWGSAAAFADARAEDPRLRSRVVFFGTGYSDRSDDAGRDEIWTWDGAVWQQICNGCTGLARQAAAVAYDPTRGRLVIAGGYSDPPNKEQAGTWELGAAGLSLVDPSNPTMRDGAAMTYLRDAAANVDSIVSYGGNGLPCVAAGGTTPFDHNCDETLLYELAP